MKITILWPSESSIETENPSIHEYAAGYIEGFRQRVEGKKPVLPKYVNGMATAAIGMRFVRSTSQKKEMMVVRNIYNHEGIFSLQIDFSTLNLLFLQFLFVNLK